MKTPIALATILATVTTPLTALAHEGHGLFGSHWHATDVLGFLAAVAAVALAIWHAKR